MDVFHVSNNGHYCFELPFVENENTVNFVVYEIKQQSTNAHTWHFYL